MSILYSKIKLQSRVAYVNCDTKRRQKDSSLELSFYVIKKIMYKVWRPHTLSNLSTCFSSLLYYTIMDFLNQV